MKYTDKQVKKAEKGDILEFADKAGVELVHTGHNEYKGVEHDSLVVTPSRNAWFWNSRNVGGIGALSFAKEYLLSEENLDKKERFLKAMDIVTKAGINEAETKEIKREPFKFNPKEIDKRFNKAPAYLIQKRGLNKNLIQELHAQGIIEQDKFGNALFLWRDPETKEIKGATKQGTWINHEKFGKRGTLKRIEPNSTYGYGFSFDSIDITQGKGKPENIRFFESSIDALSYYNLNPNKLTNTRFVSMDGLKKEVVASYINLTAKQLAKSRSRLKSIALGVDNDDAGNKFVEKMQKLQARDIDGNVLQILSAQPNTKYGKDWNDVLKHVCQVQASTLKTRLAKKQHIQHREFQLS